MIKTCLTNVMMIITMFFALITVAEEELENRVIIKKSMITNEEQKADAWVLFDEQDMTGDNAPPMGQKALSVKAWGGVPKGVVPSCYVDLGKERNISSIWLYDGRGGNSDFIVFYGKPGVWKELFREKCIGYQTWKKHTAKVKTQFLRFIKTGSNANICEIVIYEKPKANYSYEPKIEKKEIPWELKPEPLPSKRVVEAAITSRKLVDAGAPFGKLPLIDEIDLGNPEDVKKHDMQEYPKGVSKVEKIFGKECRVLPNVGGKKYMSFRIGKNKGLEAGKCYLLTVQYPEDKPRTMFIQNVSNKGTRGLHTGNTAGDVFFTYTSNNNESINMPMAGEYRTWKQLFFLHNRYTKRDWITKKSGYKVLVPANGFAVNIAQSRAENAPLSNGAAVRRIRLFAVPNPDKFNAVYSLPKDLPKRRLFYRQEMALGSINSEKIQERELDKVQDWYEMKMKTMKFLGMNTYTKPLFVFGRIQGWDMGEPGWYVPHKFPWLWRSILSLAKKYDFDVLPYLEYAGGTGSKGLASKTYAKPLGDSKVYTHIKWAEMFNLDITRPDALVDAKKMLRLTILRHKKLANFAGIWFRPRVSQMPISFSQDAVDRFTKETGKSHRIDRKDLRTDKKLLNQYYIWWHKKRKEFMVALIDYLKEGGINNPQVLFTAYPTEPGPPITDFVKGKRAFVVTDNPESLKKVFSKPPFVAKKDWEVQWIPLESNKVKKEKLRSRSVLLPKFTWGNWEWQHACPRPDPQNYADTPNIFMSYPFNRLYTVNEPKAMDMFRGKSGLAMIRHYPLNERILADDIHGKNEVLGYFVADVEYTGPYCMVAEARAMANGDPFWIGYLTSNTFNRGFPKYARNFNTAFLSLPALASTIVKGASPDPEVVVREIKTKKHGTYYAIVNTGLKGKKDLKITLPAKGEITDAPTGKIVKSDGGKLTLSFYPCELKAINIK